MAGAGFWRTWRRAGDSGGAGNLMGNLTLGAGHPLPAHFGHREHPRTGATFGRSLVEELAEVAALLILDEGEAPVVKHEGVDAGEVGEQEDVGAAGAGRGELVEEAEAPR